MKWALFLALLWCWGLLMFLALCGPGCATFSNAGRDMHQVAALAIEARSVAQALCEFNTDSVGCHYMVHSLERFYALTSVVERAIAEGLDMSEALKALEGLGAEILGVGRELLRQIV